MENFSAVIIFFYFNDKLLYSPSTEYPAAGLRGAPLQIAVQTQLNPDTGRTLHRAVATLQRNQIRLP
jgi:hypothetical protein